MAAKSEKKRGSVNFSRSLKANVKPKEEWRSRLKEQRIFNSIYSCEVLLLVESNYTLCSATTEIEEQGEESTAVKFLTPTNLITFLVNTFTTRPEYDYFGLYDEAYAELQEEYTINNKLSSESLVYLIKLRILAYNEIIAQDRALIRELKYSLQQEMGSMNDNSLKVAKKPDTRTKSVSTKPNPLDQKYLLAKAGKIPNFVETRKIPTIYNTDYDEPNPENIYYVLSGIYDASLIILLQKCNIGILSLIELSMEGVKFNQEEMVVDNLDEFEFDRMLSMRSFWRSLEQKKTDIPKVSRNTCYMKYSIPDTKTETPSFDNFLIVLKNISDFKRLYYHYFTTVRYLEVAETNKPICLSSMNNYNGLLDQVPNECISIPLMLHALLDEVCVRVDNWTNEALIALNNNKKVKRKYHGGPVVQITSLLRDYECSYKKVTPIINTPKAAKISYGNTLDFKNAHVPINQFINTTEITLNELKRTLPLRLFEKIDARNTFDIMFYKYVFSKWSEQLETVSVEELTLCVYAYLFTRGNFRKFNMPKALSNCTKENKINECMFGVTKLHNELHKVLSIHLNSSFLKLNSSVQSDQIPTVTNVKTDVEDEDGINKSCDNLSQEYATLAEELDPASFIQMINTAYNNYNHFDYKYFSPTDVILLRFHYTNDKCGFSRKNEKYFLRTPLCFRDFCYKLLLEDSEWFLKEEKEYWKQTYINKEKETEYLMQHPKVDDYYDPREFIIPGSIKSEFSKPRNSTSKRSLPKSAKHEKKKSSEDKSIRRRSLRKSKDSIFSMKQFGGPNAMRTSIGVPSCGPYDKEKLYAYEIYNLGQSFYPLEFEETIYHSFISVKLTKQQLPKEPLECTFVVSTQNANLVLHCEYDGMFKPIKPLHFNVNMINGVVMVFSIPTPPIFHVENRHIVMHTRNNDEIRNSYKNDSIRSSITKVTEQSSATDEIDPKVSELKNEVLQYLSIAMKEQLPVFKIISSRLHKYQYVKRIKSKIILPVGNIYRRVCCKPILYKRLPRKQNIYEAKCVPYSDLVNKEKSPIDWKWNCSIPTGLSMETVQANVPNDFYIRQRYVIERMDLPSIQDEAYRCYLRCGIIMKFLKDGSIKTLSPDKTLCHYKYGYFSSNKYRASKSRMKDIRLKRQTNVIPLHAYKKNLTSLEKRIRKISKKYKRHLIDIADNYRFERSRADSRKLHKIYKLSKKIYTKDSHVIPLINYSVITSEGRFIDVKNNIVHDTNRKYEEARHRDYLLNETVTRREDGTCWMIDSNGNAITQFPDGSRIKTWYTILDENMLLGEDPVEYQKRVIVVEERESLTKFCQTVDECDTINEEEDVEVLYNKEPVKEQSNSIGFVLVGMNYSFEHPNFATVSYYCWEDSSADVLMPDKINVTVYAEGTYKLNLINNDTINVSTQKVELLVHNTETMKRDVCSIHLGAFSEDKPKPDRSFLSVKENNQKVFFISCDGQTSTTTKSNTPNTSTFESANSNLCSDRMFVMKRDLSGMEMIKEPIPYKFVHTLIDLKDVMSRKDHENVVIGPTKLKIFQPLRKTYSEHLMMMYDIPILATTKERRCLDKLWKLHDLDINTIVPKRSPLVIYERHISCLPDQIIVEQLAQAVLKCIIEGNENLPDIKMIQDLVKTEEMVAEPEIEAEEVSAKKYVPKHLTYKKHIDKYKQLTKVTSIPPYFKTVRGLMFLAVEECSEAAMDESSARRSTQTHKKHTIRASLEKKPTVTEKTQYKKIQEIEKKLDKLEEKREKQKAFTKSETFAADRIIHKPVKSQSITTTTLNAVQTKLNIPDHVAVHLKPNAHVHEIILTANGLQIITDKNLENVENFYYSSQRNSQQNNTFAVKNDEKRLVVEKRDAELPVDGSDADPSCGDINEKYPSFLGEDIGNYFNSTMKIPSWDDSLCQKACLNSFITTTNTLVTTPESKLNEVKSCKQATCACSVDSIERLAKCCQCKKYYCNCKDTYSAFATCSLQHELNVSEAVCVLATKIIQTIEKDPAKFNLLNTKLPYIIRDTAIAWAMSGSVANDLTKTLKWIIDNKLKKQNTIPEVNAIDIVKHIEATVSKIKISNRTVPLTIGNLQKMADLVLNFVCNSKNKVNITKEIRKLLHDAKISRADIIDTLKLAKEKIHLYYEHGLYPDLPIPEVPPESKCCKIAQYIDYLLDNILEGTCEKCNLRSFVVNTSIHNTSPVNYSSKASFQKSEQATQKMPQVEPQTPNNSNVMTNNVEISEDIYYGHEKEKPNIIVEPLHSPVRDTQTNDDEAFDISSAGGFSLIKSCEEIVDVSIPFITKKDTNLNENSKSQPVQQVQSREDFTDEDNKYFLSKIKFASISEVPDAKDIITIMAPEHHLDCVMNETNSAAFLSPLLLRPQRTSNTKPIVYDGNIISK